MGKAMARSVVRPRPTLGVLGGMGPAATADFLQRLARLTPADRDQDHVPTIVYSDPQTPDRSDAILGRGPSPLPAMIRGVEFLNQAGCAVIAIPCNSAHYWHRDLAAHSQAPILHIANATAEQLPGAPDLAAVGIMATDGTTRSGIYEGPLRDMGVSLIDLLDLGDANPIMRGIRLMKAGEESDARANLLAGGEELVRRGAKALVVACTDISAALAAAQSVNDVPLVDASDCLARASLNKLAARPL
jgi:aspartate racemase